MPSEISFFKSVFEGISGAHIRIFEWGSGNSTLFYAKLLKARGQSFEWHAVENSESWAAKMRERVKEEDLNDCIHIEFKPFSAFFEKPSFSWANAGGQGFSPSIAEEQEYIDFPKTLGGRFDLMIVDGRFRRRCLLVSKEVLSTDGVVLLHDAERPHYHSALDGFTHQSFFSGGKKAPGSSLDAKVWVGSMGNAPLIKTLSNFPS